MHYKLEQACVTNCSSFVLLQIRENVVTNWGSFIIINWGNCCYKLGQQLQIRATQGFKNQKSWYTVFCAPNNMFAYTTVHLKFLAPQIVVCARVQTNVYLAVHLPQSQKHFRAVEGKLRVYFNRRQTRTQSGDPDCFYREINNRWDPCLPRTKQPDNFLSTEFESSEHGRSFPVFVGLRQQDYQQTF